MHVNYAVAGATTRLLTRLRDIQVQPSTSVNIQSTLQKFAALTNEQGKAILANAAYYRARAKALNLPALAAELAEKSGMSDDSSAPVTDPQPSSARGSSKTTPEKAPISAVGAGSGSASVSSGSQAEREAEFEKEVRSIAIHSTRLQARRLGLWPAYLPGMQASSCCLNTATCSCLLCLPPHCCLLPLSSFPMSHPPLQYILLQLHTLRNGYVGAQLSVLRHKARATVLNEGECSSINRMGHK